MIQVAAANPATSSKPNDSRPPRVRLPKLVQGIRFAFGRHEMMRRCIKRHGHIFEIDVPFFGRSVVVSDPVLARSVCAAGADLLVNVQPNLSNWFGPGSTFGLDGNRHRNRRRLLAPALHGQSIRNYERLIEDETLREIMNWPQQQEIRTLEPMNRIALNVILRTLFNGSETDLDVLRAMIPPYIRLGQLLGFAPAPPDWVRSWSPWSKLDNLRSAFDRIVCRSIDAAESDPNLADRRDILALLVRNSHGPCTAISRQEICDEMSLLVCAGHETTATALAWTFERLRRHPDVLAELISEVDEGGSAFRHAAILESLRVRTVIDVFGRRVSAPHFDLGGWRIPRGRTVLVRIADLHGDPTIFSKPECFDPHRFFGAAKPAPSGWLPFGGGARRCLGADFAIAEMDVVLRTVLRQFSIRTDSAAGERSCFRGVAHIPSSGGSVVVTRRN